MHIAVSEIWSDATEWNVENFEPVKARFFKLISFENNQSVYAGVWEFEVWGSNQTTDNSLETNNLNTFELFQNYPNPFNPTTNIRYTIPSVTLSGVEGPLITLKVFDILGNEVATLVNEVIEPGNHTVLFDATGLASGVYVYRIESQGFVDTKKMVLLR